MNNVIITMYDSVACSYETLSAFSNVSVARRCISELLQTNKILYPDDKIFFVIGTFDSLNGVVIPCEPFELFEGVNNE